jgi:hypothetical protein
MRILRRNVKEFKMKELLKKLDYKQGDLLSLIDELEIINDKGVLDEIIEKLQEANELINEKL